jgi:formamidopyrimidine-DNA glycosylase
MPELPEVETVRRGLAAAWTGQSFVSVEARRESLRFPLPPDFGRRLEGRTVKSVGRRAKYLVIDLSDGMSLISHLGMSGSFRLTSGAEHVRPAAYYHATPRLEKHDHVVFTLSNGCVTTYNDPRRFGFMLLLPTAEVATSERLGELGLEPLDGDLDAATLANRMAGRRTSLKAALLDQTLIAGLGNIYACEALHRAGLSPRRGAWTLAKRDGAPNIHARALAPAIVEVLQEAVEAGGSTLRDFSSTGGTIGNFQHRFRVYDRVGQPCPRPDCGGTIIQIVQSGRSTYFCPRCQR